MSYDRDIDRREPGPHQLMHLRDCRQRINAAGRRDMRVDGSKGTPTTGSLIRSVLTLAEHEGYSGEDTMTLLAFEALKLLEQANDRQLDMLMLAPARVQIHPNDPSAPAMVEFLRRQVEGGR